MKNVNEQEINVGKIFIFKLYNLCGLIINIIQLNFNNASYTSLKFHSINV